MDHKRMNRIAERVADVTGSPAALLILTVLLVLGFVSMLWFDVNRVLLVITTWLSIEARYAQLLTQLVVTNAKKEKQQPIPET
ncbi:MAG: hypothetical protein MSG64_15685 [Pyrinomonadaceae bacterium MAG19_C2-C3]|nr:hypothetical protein [Pyrinomonadaceae bacterium MAG19_C2-C3]